MSNSKILDYVMKTPGNTNRTILAQMIDSETSGVLEAAKAYTDSQRLAYDEKDVYAYDESKVFLAARVPEQFEVHASWVSPDIVSLEQVIGEELIVEKNGEIIKTVIKEENCISSSEGSFGYIDLEISTFPLCIIIPTYIILDRYNAMAADSAEAEEFPEVGLYITDSNFLLEDNSVNRVKVISLAANIIHKINPKFLPSSSNNYDIVANYFRYDNSFAFEKGDYFALLRIVEEGSVPNMLFKVQRTDGTSVFHTPLSASIQSSPGEDPIINIEAICDLYLVKYSISNSNFINSEWREFYFPPM